MLQKRDLFKGLSVQSADRLKRFAWTHHAPVMKSSFECPFNSVFKKIISLGKQGSTAIKKDINKYKKKTPSKTCHFSSQKNSNENFIRKLKSLNLWLANELQESRDL